VEDLLFYSIPPKTVPHSAWQDVVRNFFEDFEKEIEDVEIPSYPTPAQLATKETCP